MCRRKFDFDLAYSGNRTEPAVNSGRPVTLVRLHAMRPDYAKFVPKDAQTVAREFMSHFLPVLLATNDVEIVIIDGDEEIRLREVFQDELLIGSRDQPFAIGSRTFTVSLVRLRPKIALRHKLILAASLREVHADNLDKYIPVLAAGPLAMAGEPNGFWLVSIVQGSFLNEAVNPMRVAFTDENIEGAPPAEGDGDDGRPADEHVHEEPTTDLFGEPKSIKVIRADALKAVREELEPVHRGGGAGPV